MKLLKVVVVLFIVTLLISVFKTNAKEIYIYSNATISWHGAADQTGSYEKEREGNQYFESLSSYDKITNAKRSLKVTLIRDDISVSQTQEISADSTKEYTKSSLTVENTDYHLVVKTANILSNDVRFTGTWYLDPVAYATYK